ncbi:hypothetical protein EGT74_03560 [Chitinophaga lutea]|uniref:Uncharacterized protein n=1 Tax=Chitinophaga lutea TaxID=2488634 RepID=A0A3N4Q9B5_9BACT|nr:hypothetical protein EGT74_03560 [Chitinophaga lutea]
MHKMQGVYHTDIKDPVYNGSGGQRQIIMVLGVCNGMQAAGLMWTMDIVWCWIYEMDVNDGAGEHDG